MDTLSPARQGHEAALARVHDLAREFLRGLGERSVGPRKSFEELLAALGGPLPEQGAEPRQVIEALSRAT